MTTETTSRRGLITWSTDPADPCRLRWRYTYRGAHWQGYTYLDTPQEAAALAHHLAMTNYTPTEQPTQGAPTHERN